MVSTGHPWECTLCGGAPSPFKLVRLPEARRCRLGDETFMTGVAAQGPIVETRQTDLEFNMTHDDETETAAAVIKDLLYLIPAHLRRSDKPQRAQAVRSGRAKRDNSL